MQGMYEQKSIFDRLRLALERRHPLLPVALPLVGFVLLSYAMMGFAMPMDMRPLSLFLLTVCVLIGVRMGIWVFRSLE